MSEHDEKCEYELWSGPSCECGCAYRALEKAYEGQARTIQEKAQCIAELEAQKKDIQDVRDDLRERLDAVEKYANRCAIMRMEPTTAGLRAALGGDDE